MENPGVGGFQYKNVVLEIPQCHTKPLKWSPVTVYIIMTYTMEHEGCGHRVDKYISTFEVGEMSTGYALEIQDLETTTRRSENDDTPQPLDQWTNSPFIGQQVGNWSICHALWPIRKPIVHPTLYPTHISFIPSQWNFPFLKYGY